MYSIGFAIKFNPMIHGGHNCDYLIPHFIHHVSYTADEFYNDEYLEYMDSIIGDDKELKIIYTYELPTGESCAVDKTVYLRILQRRIKKRYSLN
jgi:hypothetical protein